MCVGAFAAFHLFAAAQAGNRGRVALSRAESNLSARRLEASSADLATAETAFGQADREIDALGPLAAIARRTPLLGRQVRAVDAFVSAGLTLSRAGLDLVAAAGTLVDPDDENRPVAEALDALRTTHESLVPAVAAIEAASTRVAKVKRSLLLPALSRARRRPRHPPPPYPCPGKFG